MLRLCDLFPEFFSSESGGSDARFKPKWSFNGRDFLKVLGCHFIESIGFNRCQPVIAPTAEKTANKTAFMIVVYERFCKWLSATGTTPILIFDHFVKIRDCHAVPFKPETKRTLRIHSVNSTIDIPIDAFFATRSVPVTLTGLKRKRIQWFQRLASSAEFFSFRFRKISNVQRVKAACCSLACFALAGYPKSIAWIDIKIGQLLIDSTGGTYFHSTSLPLVSYS